MKGETTSTSRALFKAFRVAPELKKGIWLTLLLAVVGTALQLVVPVVLQRVIDNEILGSGDVNPAAVLRLGLAALVAVGFAMVARWISLKRWWRGGFRSVKLTMPSVSWWRSSSRRGGTSPP